MKKVSRLDRFIKKEKKYMKDNPHWYNSWITLLITLLAIAYEATH